MSLALRRISNDCAHRLYLLAVSQKQRHLARCQAAYAAPPLGCSAGYALKKKYEKL